MRTALCVKDVIGMDGTLFFKAGERYIVLAEHHEDLAPDFYLRARLKDERGLPHDITYDFFDDHFEEPEEGGQK